jgi:subtilisin family serine protease
MLLLGISRWYFSLSNEQLKREWVVRFNDEISLDTLQWPEEISVVSLHQPTHCAVIQSTLSENAVLNFAHSIDSTAFVSVARKDIHGSPIYPTGSVILALENNSDPNRIAKQLNCAVEQHLEQLQWISVRIPLGTDYESFKEQCLAISGVKDVFADEIIVCQSHQTNDPLYNTSWHIAQSTDKDIDADEGWNLLPVGAANMSIAVIEGVGFDTLNADLSGRFIDRYNATNQTTNVYSNATLDKHGTAVAGIPGAICNNAISAAGLGKNKLWLQVIRIGYNTTSSGTFSTSSSFQASAINRAISLSTTAAISMSFGSTTYQTAFYNAIQSALTQGRSNKGIPVFGSSGNAGLSSWTNYPASYGNVIAVGATTGQDLRSTTSNYGPALTLSAPGSSIATTDITGANGYSTGDNTYFSGTSAAAPVAASVGALMIVANPNLTAAQVKQYLAQSCEKVGGYAYTNNNTQNLSTWSNELGYGRVNMRAALQLCLPQTTGIPDIFASGTSVSSSTPTVGTTLTIQATQNTSLASTAAITSTLEYRYSLDGIWSADDVVIGTDASLLGGGIGSEIENITYTIPSGTGSRYILIMADASGQISESNENNNLTVIPITVSTGSTLPDVFITGASISANTATVGQTITINGTQNRNPLASANSYSSLQYRLSPDAVWESTDTYIGSDISTFTASIGAEAENITYIIPNNPGNRYILLRCDASNTTAESNETNNVVAIPITIVAAAVQEETPNNIGALSEIKLTLFPNPAHEKITLDTHGEPILAGWIYGTDGRIHTTIDAATMHSSADIRMLNPGVYMLRLATAKGDVYRRFIKE